MERSAPAIVPLIGMNSIMGIARPIVSIAERGRMTKGRVARRTSLGFVKRSRKATGRRSQCSAVRRRVTEIWRRVRKPESHALFRPQKHLRRDCRHEEADGARHSGNAAGGGNGDRAGRKDKRGKRAASQGFNQLFDVNRFAVLCRCERIQHLGQCPYVRFQGIAQDTILAETIGRSTTDFRCFANGWRSTRCKQGGCPWN